MRKIKFYIGMVLVIGLFLSVNITSFAGERYSFDVEKVKKAAAQSMWDGEADIEWSAKVRNNTNIPQTYEVKINFLDGDNQKIHEATVVATVYPNRIKAVSNIFYLKSSEVKEIHSGFISISKLNEQSLIARLY